MKRLFTKLLGFVAIIAGSYVCAASPTTIINNTKGEIDFNFSHCNNGGKLCALGKQIHLLNRSSSSHTATIMAPIGMDKVIISSANMYDASQNKVASMSGQCTVPANASAVILDNYGSNKIYCTFAQGI
jgi:hypothetical protein